MIAASDETTAVLRSLPIEVEWRTGQFGMLAAVAAFAPESDEWLDGLLATLDENRRLLASLTAAYEDAPTPEEEDLQRQMRRQQRKIVKGEW